MNHSTTRLAARVCAVLVAVLLLVGPAYAKPGNHGKHGSKADAHRKNDRDKMPNGWEKKHGLDRQKNDAQQDSDGDLLVNIEEYQNDTDPQNPDTDGDGFTDGQEVLVDDTDPTDPEDNLTTLLAEEALEGEEGLEEEFEEE